MTPGLPLLDLFLPIQQWELVLHQGCLRLCCLPDNLLLPIMSSLIWKISKAFCEQVLSLRVVQGSGYAHVVVKVLQR